MEDKIINYLERFPNSKAKVISKALGIDKSRINSLLYGKLKNIVQSNKQYEWSLKKSTSITSNNTFEETKAETRISEQPKENSSTIPTNEAKESEYQKKEKDSCY